mmetsp:Transcript_9575/g.22735  ORF Transcript_9575/g.22735 Transcript_9575/m.22735 type:complete len:209 (-) Transcript_9575:1204-1830(-)
MIAGVLPFAAPATPAGAQLDDLVAAGWGGHGGAEVELLACGIGPLANFIQPVRLAAGALQSQDGHQHAQQRINVPIRCGATAVDSGQVLPKFPMREARVPAIATLEALVVLATTTRGAQLTHAAPSQEELMGELGHAIEIGVGAHGRQHRAGDQEPVALALRNDTASSSTRRLNSSSLGSRNRLICELVNELEKAVLAGANCRSSERG